VRRHSGGELSPFLASGCSFAVHPVFFGYVHTTVIGIAVFNIHANPGTVERIQELLQRRSLAEALQFSKSMNEIICKRSRVGRVLFDGLPADRRGTWWRNKEILLHRGRL
jgi:hypothetical protein